MNLKVPEPEESYDLEAQQRDTPDMVAAIETLNNSCALWAALPAFLLC